MKQVSIYTDGSSLGNPGPGGWGAILQFGPHERALSGAVPDTTNNRMELTAVIEGLKLLKEPCRVHLYSDSQYVVNAMEKGWAKSWKQRGWKRADKQPALNPDLWAQLLDLCQTHEVRFFWVKGHAGHPQNERCDALATAAARALQQGGAR